MCYFSRQSKEATTLENRYRAKLDHKTPFQPQPYNIGFEYPKTPVITHNNPELITHFNWGLIPYWAKDRTIRKYTLNARIETLHEKPSFRNSVSNRCLVLTDGYFEWRWLDPKGIKKQKYLITLPDNSLFAFGGIWSEWINKKNGKKVYSYSIVTTKANELLCEVHNTKKRMPVVLNEQNETDWLAGHSIGDFKNIETEMAATKV